MTIRKTLILSALLASGLAAAHDHGGKHHKRGDLQAALAQVKISALDAIASAEKDTGARAKNIDLELRRGKAVYDIDLFDDKQEYEIRIDAESGSIVSRKTEIDDDLPKSVAISLAQAVETAERDIGGKVVDAELEKGIVYEVKLVKDDGTRHFAHISAESGNIVDSGEYQGKKRGRKHHGHGHGHHGYERKGGEHKRDAQPAQPAPATDVKA
ncbi:MAG: PepSY domain-containing protein [Cardiobacteriaceae bacterium]|nr:PepSY domain-containing protein [Cardiobacteriaceae bacterium]